MLLWATWSWRLRLRLGGPSPFVHESRSPWGTGHDALVNQNSKTKAYPYHPSFLWSIFTNSIFPDSAVGRGQGSPRKVTVWISKSSKHLVFVLLACSTRTAFQPSRAQLTRQFVTRHLIVKFVTTLSTNSLTALPNTFSVSHSLNYSRMCPSRGLSMWKFYEWCMDL